MFGVAPFDRFRSVCGLDAAPPFQPMGVQATRVWACCACTRLFGTTSRSTPRMKVISSQNFIPRSMRCCCCCCCWWWWCCCRTGADDGSRLRQGPAGPRGRTDADPVPDGQVGAHQRIAGLQPQPDRFLEKLKLALIRLC